MPTSRPSILLFSILLSPGIFLGAEPEYSQAQLDYFENHIRPLLVTHCYQCHSTSAGQQEGGLLLDQRDALMRGGDSGPAVSPGQADKSLLLRAVGYQDPDLQMPPDEPLSKDLVQHLRQWIEMGAPAPKAFSTATAPGEDPSDPETGRQHWAFQPLPETVVPTDPTGWAKTPIDSFIIQRLGEQSLPPAADADRSVLLRRLHFLLTGLPPTVDQLQRFVDSTDPQVTERVIDSLLASRQFAERFGRHWMDLARYADSNGLDENFLFREAWRYRNWIISAVDRDMPYPEFLLHQIAGDLLPYDSVPQRDFQRIGAGFLVVGPKVLLGNDAAERKMDVADEQLDTIGKTVLGQSLGCARCHNHKI